jgi:hypothetical protein
MTFVFYFFGVLIRLQQMALGVAFDVVLDLPHVSDFVAGSFSRFAYLVGSDIADAVFAAIAFQLTVGVGILVLALIFKKVWGLFSRH